MKRFSTLHISNTEFELEFLQNKVLKPFSFHHPISIQLQSLPFLFANPDDGIVIKGKVPDDYFKHLVDLGLPDFSRQVVSPDEKIECQELRSWGMSRGVAKWAEKMKLPYEMPDWNAVREVNSKLFSFSQLPHFENAELIHNKDDLLKWVNSLNGKGVLKTAFGFSGMGKVIVDEKEPFNRLLVFCQKEWRKGRPMIAEPWLQKTLDFSSHWQVGKKEIKFLGLTRVINDAFGAYRGSVSGPALNIPFTDEHNRAAIKVLKEVQKKGYFGSVGIDAMIYEKGGALKLHPLVEINARQTMSQVVLRFQQKYFSHKNLLFEFISSGQDKKFLLPNKITNFDGKEIIFNKQFYFKTNA